MECKIECERMNLTQEYPGFESELSESLYRELNAFAEQIGSPDGLTMLGAAPVELKVRSVVDLDTLQEFLEGYLNEILQRLELPVIRLSCHHASRYQTRELIALDELLANKPILNPFAAVSQRVGLAQLRALRPLRDDRVVRRYLEAAERGEARAWHTVVYGLMMSVYSLPLRQGLIHYGTQTLRGFVVSAGTSLGLPEPQLEELHGQLCSRLPGLVEIALAGEPAFA
jgi:urease accessory protein UreF